MFAVNTRDLLRSFRTTEGTRRVVVDVGRFALAEGEQAALRGASGTGKTTFLHLLAGILPADSGSVCIAGVELGGLGEPARDRLRAERIGYVFQSLNLLPGHTAIENVELPMWFAGRRDPGRARALLARVGLEGRLHDFPRQLSVGQQQRVAVARALVNRPRLVLADEPTAHLDPVSGAGALALLREICLDSGAALLLVTHDPEALRGFARVEEFAAVNRAPEPATTGTPS